MQPPTTDEVTEALDLHSSNMPSSRSRDSASLSSSSVRTEKVSTALGGMTSPSSIPIDGVGDPEKAVVDPSLQRVSSPNKGDMPWTIKGNDWNGQDDPDNPHNWTLANRIYHTIMPALFSFVVTFASSVYTPGIPDVMEQFHVSSTVALLGLSLYVLGLGFGPVLAAPLSELHGRKAVYLISLPLSAIFILGAGFANNFATLAICRFFAGFFGSPCLAIGGGTNADVWPPVYRAIATSSFLLAPFLGPALGPAVGGFAAENKGWRWTQWPILFAAVVAYTFSLCMKETYKKVILQRRAKRLGLPLEPKTGPSGLAAVKILLTVTLTRPLHMILTEPIVGFFSLYTGFNFAVVFAFFAAYPLVFQGVYEFDSGMTGLTFLGIGIGVMLGVPTFVVIDRLTFRKQHQSSLAENRLGVVAPEHRLYPAMLGSVGLPIGLFWFAWTARSDVHWISPVIASVPFAWGNYLIFCSAALYLVDTYGPLNGASALAANGLVRYVMGAAFPLFTVQMYHKLGIAWATSLLGFVAVALLPVPWVLFGFGKRIRRKSGYETIEA